MTGQRPTILVVDDEVDLRDAIAFDFKRKNFNVLTASSGQEALALLNQNKNVDVVLSDVRMPNGDGLELLQEIKARDVFKPVVILITGFADITLEEAYDKGADAVFTKPFDRQALLDSVTRSIQPADQKFLRNGSRVELDLPIGIKFLKSDFRVQARVQNIGRGGMFVALNDKFPQAAEEAEFKIEISSEKAITLIGGGLIRWVRLKDANELRSGCGVEFVFLNDKCKKEIIELINFIKTKSFIPKN